MQERLTEEAEKELKFLYKALAQREKESKDKHVQLVNDVVCDLISLSLRCAEYRSQSCKAVPQKEYRNWKALFMAGMLII